MSKLGNLKSNHSVTLADVLGGYDGTTITFASTYEITDTYLTCEALSFGDNTYYNSIGDKDLRIGFNEWPAHVFFDAFCATLYSFCARTFLRILRGFTDTYH
jgi:hypothetical protein